MCIAFLDICNDEKYFNINIGFNANAAQKFKEAYDLPWILNRAFIDFRNVITGSSKWFLGGNSKE